MLAFVSYAYFSKKMQKLCFYFYSKFVKNTSITTQQTKTFTLFTARNFTSSNYSQPSQRRTPLGPALAVCLREVSVL